MLTWREPLYIEDQLKKREKRLKKRLNDGKADVGHYLITLSQNPNDNLDIISTSYLKQRSLYNMLPTVVGIAASKTGAIKLVRLIAEDCLAKTKGLDIRAFLTEE